MLSLSLRYAFLTPKLPLFLNRFGIGILFSHSHALNPNGNVDDAILSFNHMLRMRPPPRIEKFNKILSSLVKIKHYPTPISLFKQMQLSGIKPIICTLNILMNCFCQLREPQMLSAFSVLTKILKMGYQPDSVTFTILIKGLCLKGGEIKEALHFHDRVVAHGCQLEEVSYGTLINGLCKMGHTRAAIQFLRKIEGQIVKPNVSRRISYAWEFVDEMHERGQHANIITYNSLLDALCKNHHLDKAIALLKKFEDEGIQPDEYTYSILIDGLCKGGRLHNAREVFHHFLIKGHHPDVHMCTAMINGLCSEGLFDEALALKSKMEENHCLPNAVTFETIIKALLEKNKNDKAEQLLREMASKGLL